MIRPFDSHELDELFVELFRPGAVAELGILAGCLVVAWIVVRLIRGRDRPVASPGGAGKIGRIGADTALVAGYPPLSA